MVVDEPELVGRDTKRELVIPPRLRAALDKLNHAPARLPEALIEPKTN